MNKQILHLAIPSIISNITVPLLGFVDVAITGHMGDARYMAAIAVGSMLFNIMYWMFSFLRFGTGGMTAQTYGQKNSEECALLLFRSQITSFAVALGLFVMQVPLFALAMWVIQPAANLISIIHTYYGICIFGTFPSLALYAFTGWFVGMQNTRFPMVISITQNIINICLSYVLVFFFGMKIAGVAYGTLIAQWCGALMAIALIVWKYGGMFRTLSNLRAKVLRMEAFKRFFMVNQTIFLRTIFLIAVNLYFIKVGARGGAIILAVNAMLMQFFIFYTYVMDGFAFAAEALCGRYYGAKDSGNFSLAMKGVWKWGLLLTVAYTLFYAFGGDFMVSLMTDDSVIRFASRPYMPWAVAIPFCGLAAFVWDGVFVGITNIKGMLLGTFVGAMFFFAILSFPYPFDLTTASRNNILWCAFDAYLIMRGVTQTIVWKRKPVTI
ncbi:MAG: MATE family efflux transporter [Prevotella sp.]|nr:MATE family efflux transporter [Prevotella sp.]